MLSDQRIVELGGLGRNPPQDLIDKTRELARLRSLRYAQDRLGTAAWRKWRSLLEAGRSEDADSLLRKKIGVSLDALEEQVLNEHRQELEKFMESPAMKGLLNGRD